MTSPTGHNERTTDVVTIPATLYTDLLRHTQDLHTAGLKGYGLMLADPTDPHFPYRVVDMVLFDPSRNRRNDPAYQPAFHAQGSYFRQYEDAGFVADPADLYHVWRTAEAAGLEPVAPFHVHRRQPCNFSSIDFRLHNPAFGWHLIISLREPGHPVVQPFAVDKVWEDFGIDDDDALEGSELACGGPEVRPLQLALSTQNPMEQIA
jgi:proteasome lid subunit RPN8/RPN11